MEGKLSDQLPATMIKLPPCSPSAGASAWVAAGHRQGGCHPHLQYPPSRPIRLSLSTPPGCNSSPTMRSCSLQSRSTSNTRRLSWEVAHKTKKTRVEENSRPDKRQVYPRSRSFVTGGKCGNNGVVMFFTAPRS